MLSGWRELVDADRDRSRSAADGPLGEGDRPAVGFHCFEQRKAAGAERVGHQHATTRREVGLEDVTEEGVQPLRVQHIGAKDEIIAVDVAPVGPIGDAMLDGDSIALGVATAEVERDVESIGLDDACAEGGCDDARKTGAGAQLEDAAASECIGPRDELVGERDRRRPEHDTIGDEPLLLAEIVGFVGRAEDGAAVLDAPRMSVETEMIIVERMIWLIRNGCVRDGCVRA